MIHLRHKITAMSNRRRLTIILVSVLIGSLMSVYIVKKRMGGLSREAYIQLGFNFFFAVAIVIGIGLIFNFNNKKDKNS